MLNYVNVFWSLSFIIIFCTGVVKLSNEKQLITELLTKYKRLGKIGRPVLAQNDSLEVKYGLSLIQILDLDERNQVLAINVWATYEWKDLYMAWTPADHSNITEIRVPIENLWTPDIKLYNYADTRLKELREALAVVYYDGTITYIPQAVFKSSCKIDIRHFPFDQQNCSMKFGSWTYDGTKLDLKLRFPDVDGFELNDYVESNEWELLNSQSKRNILTYPCCPQPYLDITFTIKIRRKVAFYNYILILPCVLLSSLTLVLFWLPPESPAKMQLGMNIFVAFFVLLLLLAESTPPAASSIPLIGAYYCLNMVLITLSTLLSVVVVNLYFHGSRSRVPVFFKHFVVDILSKVFCMHALVHDAVPKDLNATNLAKLHNKDNRKFNDHKYDKVAFLEMQSTDENWKPFPNGNTNFPLSDTIVENSPNHNVPALTALETDVHDIKRYLTGIVDRVHEKEAREKVAKEWKMVALVLDRLFFFIYLIAILASVFSIFQNALFAD